MCRLVNRQPYTRRKYVVLVTGDLVINMIAVTSHVIVHVRLILSCDFLWDSDCCLLLPACPQKVDIAFALDASGSVGRVNFQRQLDFVRSVVLGLNRDVRVTAGTYADDASVLFQLNTYTDRAQYANALGGLYYTGGTTNTAAALRRMREVNYYYYYYYIFCIYLYNISLFIYLFWN